MLESISQGLPQGVEIAVIFTVALVCVLIGFWSGYRSGKQRERDRIEKTVAAELQKRRHDLADRGRTTERRPEHDGEPASRNAKIVVRSRRAPRPDHPSDQRQ